MCENLIVVKDIRFCVTSFYFYDKFYHNKNQLYTNWTVGIDIFAATYKTL